MSAQGSNIPTPLHQLVAKGDEAAFRQLFNQYWDQVYLTAVQFLKNEVLAEDLAQEVFAKIWVHRQKLGEVNQLEAYLFVVARNLVFDHFRKKVLDPAAAEDIKNHFYQSATTPADTMELKEMANSLAQAIERLPPQQQTAFRLSRFENLSHEEIARQMGISRDTVKSYIVRSLATLRKSCSQFPLLVTFFL